MDLKDSITIMKALADSSRMMIINSLLEKSQCPEELSERLHLAPSTISFHLKKLEQANLVIKEKQQYYSVFSLNNEIFHLSLRDMVSFVNLEKTVHEERIADYRKKVLQTFFDYGKLVRLPSQHKKRLIVLEEIAKQFEKGKVYHEREVNDVITRFYDDYCTVRRELIDTCIMKRDKNKYWLQGDAISEFVQLLPDVADIAQENNDEKEKKMNKRAILKSEYKQKYFPKGILQIKNLNNNKVFLVSSLNLNASSNRLKLQLKVGSHPNKELQQDWNKLGSENFSIDILETLEKNKDQDYDYSEDLAILEHVWFDKLKPYGENGYHKKKK